VRVRFPSESVEGEDERAASVFVRCDLISEVMILLISITDELHVFSDDAELLTFFSGCFIIPLIKLKSAIDVDLSSFGEILTGEFGVASPEGYLDVGGFLDLVVIVIGSVAIDGEIQFGDSGSSRGVSEFNVLGDSSNEDDFVDVGHGFFEWLI